MWETKLVPSCSFTFVVTFITGPPRILVLKVTNFHCSFGKYPENSRFRISSLHNKIGDTFLDCKLFTADFSLNFVPFCLKFSVSLNSRQRNSEISGNSQLEFRVARIPGIPNFPVALNQMCNSVLEQFELQLCRS